MAIRMFSPISPADDLLGAGMMGITVVLPLLCDVGCGGTGIGGNPGTGIYVPPGIIGGKIELPLAISPAPPH